MTIVWRVIRALGSGLAGSSGGIVIRDWRTWRSAETTAMMLIPRVMLKNGIGTPKSMWGWPTSSPPSQATLVVHARLDDVVDDLGDGRTAEVDDLGRRRRSASS